MRKNKCSLKVTKNGRRLHGTSALLHMTSSAGGFDEWVKTYSEKIANEAAENAVRELFESQQKPTLKVV